MEWSALQTVIAFVGLLFTVGLVIVGGVWKFAQMKTELLEALQEHRDEIDKAIADARQEAFSATDRLRRESGEMIIAMQAKINQFELWTRDTFVRRESFLLVINETKASWQQATEKIDKRLDKIDEKLDELRTNPPPAGRSV